MVIIATLLIVILHFIVPTISLWWAVVPTVLMVVFYVAGFVFLTKLFK